jgi:hypothetical protein
MNADHAEIQSDANGKITQASEKDLGDCQQTTDKTEVTEMTC